MQLLRIGARIARSRQQAVLDSYHVDASPSDEESAADRKLRDTLRVPLLSCARIGVKSQDLVWVTTTAPNLHASGAPQACSFMPAVADEHLGAGSWMVKADPAQHSVDADMSGLPRIVAEAFMFPRHRQQPLTDCPFSAVDRATMKLFNPHLELPDPVAVRFARCKLTHSMHTLLRVTPCRPAAVISATCNACAGVCLQLG